jgi:hypothetical protein
MKESSAVDIPGVIKYQILKQIVWPIYSTLFNFKYYTMDRIFIGTRALCNFGLNM